MSLAEDNSIKRSRELKRDDHPCLLTGHVQSRDLRHVAGLLPLLSKRLNLSMGNLGRVQCYLVGSDGKISTCVKCRRRRRREVCSKHVLCLRPLPPVMRNVIKLQDKWSPGRIPVNASGGEMCLICSMMVCNGIIKSILSLTNKYNSGVETGRLGDVDKVVTRSTLPAARDVEIFSFDAERVVK